MHRAAQVLVGHHDFTSFRSSECQAKSPLRTMDAVAVTRSGEEVHVTVRSRSFLHNQVRIMVGTLKLVGEGRWRSEEHTSELQSLMRISYAVFCLKKKKNNKHPQSIRIL